VEDVQTLRLLIAATKYLASRTSSSGSADAGVSEASRLVAEAGVVMARVRRLEVLQEMLLEVTALVAAGVDGAKVEAKLGRAMRMADEFAVERGAGASVSATGNERAAAESATGP
jgi:hypothetical protein